MRRDVRALTARNHPEGRFYHMERLALSTVDLTLMAQGGFVLDGDLTPSGKAGACAGSLGPLGGPRPVHGYLTHKKPHLPRTLLQAYA